jgi:SecD/SecF fusion protein
LREELVAEAKTELGLDASQEQIDQYVEQQLDQLSELRDVAVSSTPMPGEQPGLRFMFDTSNRKIFAVETILRDLFPGKLAHNDMSYTPVAMMTGEAATPAVTTQPAGPNQPPATPGTPPQPQENQGSAVSRGDETLLAMADWKDVELALNQDPQEPLQQTPAEEKPPADAVPPADEKSMASTTLKFREKIAHDALASKVQAVLSELEFEAEFELLNADHTPGSSVPFDTWELRLKTDAQAAEQVVENLQEEFAQTPVFPASSNIGGKVAGSTRNQAIYALLASLVLIVAYIWVRFEKVIFGLAAVVALVHDVLISLGAIAVGAYLAQWLGPVAEALMIDPFKIDLTIVAALLTIVGYSLNDTIVVFDRIREVRGKSKVITKEMLNLSVNQTLGRTILTGLTTMFVLIILYFWGGTGIHGFAYCLLIGMIVGTYSSIYVASPILLWLLRPDRQGSQARAEPNFAKSGYLQDRQRA